MGFKIARQVKNLKILHFAIENFARIPANMVWAEKQLGHESYLAIPFKPAHYFADEDFCLNLPFIGNRSVFELKKLIGYKHFSDSNKRKKLMPGSGAWQAGNPFYKFLFDLRDKLWEKKVRRFLNQIKIESFDLLVLDGGAGFLRNGKIVQELKKRGLKILITYCGSDFRSRGPIAAIEKVADYRLSFEHDHKIMDPSLDYYLAPFRFPAYYTVKPLQENRQIRIGHAPTNRMAKGTETILTILNDLKKKHAIEIVLIENKTHTEALTLKNSCDIFIDNIGEIGYGINSLESLYMGIPTAVQIMPDLEQYLGDHPFVNINENNLSTKVVELVNSPLLRAQYAKKGKKWVERHNPLKITKEILGKLV